MSKEKNLKAQTGKASVGKSTSSINLTFKEEDFADRDESKHYMVAAQVNITITEVPGQMMMGDDPDRKPHKVSSVATVQQYATKKDGLSATFSFSRGDLGEQRIDELADSEVTVVMQRVKDANPPTTGEGGE